MLNKPATPIEPVTDILHGQPIKDDYRWLEDGDDARVKQWSEAQNAYTESVLGESAPVDFFTDKLAQNFHAATFTNPTPVHGTYFWEEKQPGEDQPSVYVRKGLDGTPRKLIDPVGLNKNNTISIDYWFISPQGTYIAYGLSESGDEMATLYVLNVATGEKEPDTILYARYSALAWLRDESGFYYTKHPDPATVEPGDEQYFKQVYLHHLGTDPAQDALIFGANRPKDDQLRIALTLDGKYLTISASQNWNRNDLYLYDTAAQQTRPLIEGFDAHFKCGTSAERIFVATNYQSENYRMLSAPLNAIPASIDDWTEIIPATDAILQSFHITASKIIVGYMKDACSLVKLFDFEGNAQGDLPLPPYSVLSGVGNRRDEEEFFFGVMTFLSPKIIYHSPAGTAECSVYRQSDGEELNQADYLVKQEWVTSKDGTKVPMFIIHRADLKQDGQNPTILYGYGCHGISQTPNFLRAWLPWLELGGVYAIANIRGGGEYGERWHREGSVHQKQNTFDDFIAGAEYLIHEQYTNAQKLGIMGGSNGGLMVGAVMTQRPDLFKAVICNVPVLDMTRFHKFLIAHRWIAEFGDPEKPEDFEYLMRWSPYHTVKEGVAYPSVLFNTAEKDTRVDPLHARKMAAQLQRVNPDGVVLLHTEKDAGHGGGKPVKKLVEGLAIKLAFFAWQLGLTT